MYKRKNNIYIRYKMQEYQSKKKPQKNKVKRILKHKRGSCKYWYSRSVYILNICMSMLMSMLMNMLMTFYYPNLFNPDFFITKLPGTSSLNML